MTHPPPPGWYADPGASGRQRYWDGRAWTDHLHPPLSLSLSLSPAPAPAVVPAATPSPPGAVAPRSRRRQVLRLVAGGVVGVVLVAALRDITRGSSRPTVAETTPGAPGSGSSPAAPLPSRDPSAALLPGLVVTDADVTAPVTVAPLPNGRGLLQPTLDLCNGTFASESQRSARLQVTAADGQGDTLLSTEAVLYRGSGGTTKAFSELRDVVAACPAGAVESPVGEPTVSTRFDPSPDGAWPQVATVERLAFAFQTTDTTGETSRSVAVYLRRGRALLGLYFAHPESPPAAVGGQTTLPGIVDLFAKRLAALPLSAVGTVA